MSLQVTCVLPCVDRHEIKQDMIVSNDVKYDHGAPYVVRLRFGAETVEVSGADLILAVRKVTGL